MSFMWNGLMCHNTYINLIEYGTVYPENSYSESYFQLIDFCIFTEKSAISSMRYVELTKELIVWEKIVLGMNLTSRGCL